jgi:hypothetical protein
VIVIDEYLAVRVVGGAWPEGLPDDEELALPASRHWRLLQRVHAPGDGQLSTILGQLSEAGRDGIRHPHVEVLGVLDPRPLLDDAAALAGRYGGGLLIAETLAAGLVHGRRLFFGTPANVGRHLGSAAVDLDIAVHVVT